MEALPHPLVPPDVDLSGLPLPRELFIEVFVHELGMSRSDAVALVNGVVDWPEKERAETR